MKSTLALLSLFGTVALAGGVTEEIAPDDSYPSGCSKAYSGSFQVTVATITESAKRDVHQRMKRTSCDTDGALLLTLDGGVLTDAKNRTGYIASNYQFQFDAPPQAGAIYTAGFSVCGNDSLALGDTTTWYQCKSGSFYNLYDRNWADQCEPVQIIAMPCDTSSSAGVDESSDGQVVATQVVTTTIVKPLSDGQPQVITTTVPVTSTISTVTPNTGVPVSQYSDGQIQVTTPASTATVPATTAATVTPNTGVPVSEYSDGQVQVTTPATAVTTAVTTAATTTPNTGVPVSEYSDGQVQVTTPATAVILTTAATTTPNTGVPVSEYSDGQVQVTTPATTEEASVPVITAVATGTMTAAASGSLNKTTSKAGNSTFQTSTASAIGSASITNAATTTPGSSASSTAISTSDGLRISAGSMAVAAVSLFAAYLAL